MIAMQTSVLPDSAKKTE